MGKSSTGWPSGREPCWRWIGENGASRSCTGRAWSARASGSSGSLTSSGGSKRSLLRPGAGGPGVFPSLHRVTIEGRACTEPAAYGLHLPRWDCRSLQQVVVEQAVVASIHYTTVAHILAEASLQPHRSRYWKTARLDEEFVRLAATVLWCYEHVEWLHRRGELVICMDEKPNLQALRRLVPTH